MGHGQPARPVAGQGLGHTVAFFKHRREGDSQNSQWGPPWAEEYYSPPAGHLWEQGRPLTGGLAAALHWLDQDLGGAAPSWGGMGSAGAAATSSQ